MSFIRLTSLAVALLLASVISGCGGGGGGGGGAAASAQSNLTGKWQVSYTEVGNDCGKQLESGTAEMSIRQNGDVVDMEMVNGQGGMDRFVGFRSGATIELFGAQVDSNRSASFDFSLTVSAAGNSFVGSMFQMEDEMSGICNRENTLSAVRIGALDPPAPPTHDFTELMDVFANSLISYCGGGVEGGTVTIDFVQAGNDVVIDILGRDDEVAFGTVSGDTIRIHVETEEENGLEIRIGTLTATPDGFLVGEVATLVDAAELCGGIEQWVVIPALADEVATLGTTFGSVAGATDEFTGSCWVDTLPDRAYHFTAPESGLYQIDTYGSETNDTVLFVLDAAGNEIACNDQAGGTSHSELLLDLAAGDMIVIVIDVFTASQSEEFQLNITHVLQSVSSDTYVNLEIVNLSGATLEVFWVNFAGLELHYGTLMDGDSYMQGTYATHPWRFRTLAGELLETYVATTDANQTVTIN